MNTQTNDGATLSDDELGNINAAGGGVSTYVATFISSILSLAAKPRVNPVNPALHPDDPADGSAWQNIRNSGGHYDG